MSFRAMHLRTRQIFRHSGSGRTFFIILCCALASFCGATTAGPAPVHAEALSPADKLSSSTAPSLSSHPALALQLARQDFQAVVLRNGSSDGEVLAIGGCCNGANSLASSELWSPGDNSWHTSGDLRSPRWLFQAVALPNGSALAIGGLGIASGGTLNSTELFIPAKDSSLQGSWTEVAAMNTPRQDFGAVLLDDGTVLAVGGFMTSTEVYDPTKDLWTQTSSMSMHDARSAFEMVKLPSGKVLAIGGRGRGSSGVLSSAELFDPATKTWQTQGSMADGRASFAAVAMPDDRVLAAGGMSGTGMMLNSSEVFDLKTGTWSQGPEMNYHRALQQGIMLPSGRVLMVGGLGGLGDLDNSILDTAEVFDPTTNEWELTDPMVSGRYVFQMVSLPNGTAMAIGGTGLQGFTSSTELFATS